MRRRLRTSAGRAVLGSATTVVAVLLLVGVALAAAGDGIAASGASVDKVGWWHEKNVATTTPAAIVTVPRPPGVPSGTLAVGAVGGAPDKITAIGILPDAAVGDTITSFTLTIKEAGQAEQAVNVDSGSAKIVACPITQFWVGGENGTWDTRPVYDCALAKAAGTRATDGTWTFDLKPIGDVWLDPSGTVAADGVVLVEDVEAPVGFQTVFTTTGSDALVVSLAYTSASPDETDLDGGSGFSDGGSGSLDTGSGFNVPSFGSTDIPVGGLPTPGTSTPDAGSTPPAVAPRTIAASSPNILGNLPGGLVLAVPLFFVLLGLLTYSLGPAGEPAAATRQRGVSRALAARSRAGTTRPSATSQESR